MASRPAVVVGLAAEARIARRLGWSVVVGGGTFAGALAAAEGAVRAGADALISFGLAGGLDPALRPGALLIPGHVISDGRLAATDPGLCARLGVGTRGAVLGAAEVVASAAEKALLFAATGAVAVDLESGAVARVAAAHGLGFAVLRAVCDPAWRDLPPAALVALDRRGGIGVVRVAGAVLARPGQVPALLALARDAVIARRALRGAVGRVGRIGGG